VTPSFEQLAGVAHEIAKEAGALALEGWRGRLEIHKKGRTDLVTHLDLASERLIKQRLAERTPQIPVVGEESGGEVVSGLQWYADPIDGTTNFAHGHPIWSVSVGLLNDGWPVAGAVVAPVLQMDWVGWQGGPALRNGAPISVSAVSDVTEAYLGTGFPYGGRDIEPDNNFASYVRVKKVVQAVRRIGSAALDCCFVAEGIYDGYWERVLNPWDVAGALAVVLSAGGQITHLDGSPPNLYQGNLLVTNGRIHEALSQLVTG
jgi:myo-inositol-1(or 4)-monophosphatase